MSYQPYREWRISTPGVAGSNPDTTNDPVLREANFQPLDRGPGYTLRVPNEAGLL